MRALQLRLFALALVLAGGTGPVAAGLDVPAAFRAACEKQLPPMSVAVTVTPLAFATDSSRDIASLSAQHRPGNGVTLGLTVSRWAATMTPGAAWLTRSDGWACMRPRFAVHIDMGVQQVYVAAEFPQGSCPFNEVLAHELRHVGANHGHARDVAVRIDALLRKHYGSGVYFGRQGELQRQLDVSVAQDWLPTLSAQLGQARLLHERIDSPQEYARNDDACAGELQRLLRDRTDRPVAQARGAR